MPKKCFVIGPIGEPGTPIRAAADDFIEYIVGPCPALRDLGYDDPIRADKLSEPGRITSQIIQLLMDAELVIADLTGNNANVYYEPCYRHAIAKPAILMALDGTRLPFDLQDNRTIPYTMQCRDAENARDELDKQIRRVNEADYRPTNLIVETVGIVALQRSANPEKEVIGQILRTIEAVGTEVAALRFEMRKVQAQQAANTNALAVAASTTPHLNEISGIANLSGISVGRSTATGVLEGLIKKST